MNDKPGWKTTEFWLTAIAMIIGVLLSSGVIESGSNFDKVIGVAATTLAAMGYTVQRSTVKKQK
jgi:hypothetical protein